MKFLGSFLFVLVVLVCNVYCRLMRGAPEIAGTPCKPGVDSYRRSLNSCTAYYLCVGGIWESRQCPNGLFWHQGGKKCGTEEGAGCVQA